MRRRRGNAVLAEAVLLLASLTAAGIFSAAVISKVGLLQSSFTTSIKNQQEMIEVAGRIVYVTPVNSTFIKAWIKNIGTKPFSMDESIDLFLASGDSFLRIPNSQVPPGWTSSTKVLPSTSTAELDIYLKDPLSNGEIYTLKLVLQTGYEDEYVFSYEGG